jgi:CBS-domain-containing membrane protein
MGTDLESNKENAYWHKPANRVMQPIVTTLHWHTPQAEIAQLVEDERPFPWCLVDDKGQFKGLVSQKSALKCLVNNISAS